MIARRSLLLVPAALAVPALLEGCATPSGPQSLDLTIKGGMNQNPDPSGHPSPVGVRIYELREIGRFNRANVFTLIAHERATLGSDLLHSEQVVISPGASLTIRRSLPEGARFLAVAVLFRDIDHADWRASARLAGAGPNKLTLRITGTSAAL